MSNEDRTYSSEFKAKVAQAAIDQGKQNLDQLSKKYDVPVSTILTWAVQLEKDAESFYQGSEETEKAEEHISDQEEVDVEVTDKEIMDSIDYGVMFDRLNIRRLVFWSVLGTILVVIFVFALREMYEYNRLLSQDAASGSTEFYQVNQQKLEATETLNSFGVVDLENGIYRIPIDSAINEMAEQQ
ncbi:transposase [Halalkalibaculum sp. DA3122]|uniref:transposase n=1 Tax=unclassified Halalkalibaculum TaxID=2964617 RepID=UPI0037550459